MVRGWTLLLGVQNGHLAIFIVIPLLIGCVTTNSQFDVLKGWTTDQAGATCAVQSALMCAAYVSEKVATQTTSYSLATYNSGTCAIIASMVPNILLHPTGSNADLLFWDATICQTTKDVFKVYQDQDLYYSDLGYQDFSTIDECINYCGTTYPDYKGIQYNYDYAPKTSGTCYCKGMTLQDWLATYGNLVPEPKWSYYEKLC